jgi:hypothetical protein
MSNQEEGMAEQLERTWATVDKADWGDGPWHDEPDKVQWVDAATGLDCMVRRGPMGGWCGYVGVPPDHLFHGAGYSDVDVEVHGGLTFGDSCDEEGDPAEAICHTPFPGRPADVWWLGFDCGHCFDLQPGLEARMRDLRLPPTRLPDLPDHLRDTYRTLEYVREQTTALAAQLAGA